MLFGAGPARDVDVWLLDLTLPYDAEVLSSDESAYVKTLVDPHRTRVTASTAAVRAILASYTGAAPEALAIERRCHRCGRSGHGKPYLAGAPRGAVEWSLSRSGDVGTLAVRRGGRVGVDVERVRPIRRAARKAEQFLGTAAAAAVAGAAEGDRSAVLLQEWTRREAVVKAAGVGVAATGSVSLDRWRVQSLLLGSDVVAALAVPA